MLHFRERGSYCRTKGCVKRVVGSLLNTYQAPQGYQAPELTVTAAKEKDFDTGLQEFIWQHPPNVVFHNVRHFRRGDARLSKNDCNSFTPLSPHQPTAIPWVPIAHSFPASQAGKSSRPDSLQNPPQHAEGLLCHSPGPSGKRTLLGK